MNNPSTEQCEFDSDEFVAPIVSTAVLAVSIRISTTDGWQFSGGALCRLTDYAAKYRIQTGRDDLLFRVLHGGECEFRVLPEHVEELKGRLTLFCADPRNLCRSSEEPTLMESAYEGVFKRLCAVAHDWRTPGEAGMIPAKENDDA